MLKQIIFSIFLIICSHAALSEQQMYASDSINIYPINITAPKSNGWQLKEQNHRRVVFANTSTNEIRIAYAALFINKTHTDKDNILEIAKYNIEAMLKETGGTPVTQNHSYTDEFSYPCVRSAVSATKTETQEKGGTVEIPFQYRFLICVKPEENIGFLSSFAYVSPKAIVRLDKEANEFSNGVRFRLPSKDGEINALWNLKDGFGIWVYPETGACDEIRTRVKYFTVFGSKKIAPPKEKLHIPTTDFGVCMDFANGKPNALCKQGYVDLEFDKEKNEYTGYLEFIMSNGMIKREKFRAAYCD